MSSRLLAYAERPAPRYTSYPSAPHFSAGVDGAMFHSWLGALPADLKLSLYLHVPYCQELCWYCGCNTFLARREETVSRFVDSLLAEIDLAAAALSARGVGEIHWGGGTPNILPPEQFTRVLARLRDRFDLDGMTAHAIELDARHLSAEQAEAYAKAGVTRASLGVQDFNAHVQRAMGRVQPYDVVEAAVSRLRAAGIRELSLDLMYGLPLQTVEDVRSSAAAAVSLGPQRVALFGYAHVPWFKKRQRLITEEALPGAIERMAQAEAAREALSQAGFECIGFDHFARADDPLALAARAGGLKRNFQGFVAEAPTAILGLGPSAISTLPQGYAQNAPEVGAWREAITGGRLATTRGHALSEEDRRRGALIERILCDFTADVAEFGGKDVLEDALGALQPLVDDGFVVIQESVLTIPPEGRPLCRLVAQAFDAYSKTGAARHSRAV